MEKSKNGLATDQHLANHLNCSRSQVSALSKKNPSFPKPIKITGGMTRWRWSDVIHWGQSLETQNKKSQQAIECQAGLVEN